MCNLILDSILSFYSVPAQSFSVFVPSQKSSSKKQFSLSKLSTCSLSYKSVSLNSEARKKQKRVVRSFNNFLVLHLFVLFLYIQAGSPASVFFCLRTSHDSQCWEPKRFADQFKNNYTLKKTRFLKSFHVCKRKTTFSSEFDVYKMKKDIFEAFIMFTK